MAKDKDWLNKDTIYTGEADTHNANIFRQLSDIMSMQNNAYAATDQQTKQNAMAKKLAGQTTAGNAAARGLGSSGIYKGLARNIETEDTQRKKDVETANTEISQKYGARDAVGQMGADFSLKQAIDNKNYTALAQLYGLLGSTGLQSGTDWAALMSKSAGEAANRAAVKNFDRTKGWM